MPQPSIAAVFDRAVSPWYRAGIMSDFDVIQPWERKRADWRVFACLLAAGVIGQMAVIPYLGSPPIACVPPSLTVVGPTHQYAIDKIETEMPEAGWF